MKLIWSKFCHFYKDVSVHSSNTVDDNLMQNSKFLPTVSLGTYFIWWICHAEFNYIIRWFPSLRHVFWDLHGIDPAYFCRFRWAWNYLKNVLWFLFFPMQLIFLSPLECFEQKTGQVTCRKLFSCLWHTYCCSFAFWAVCHWEVLLSHFSYVHSSFLCPSFVSLTFIFSVWDAF